MSIENLLEDFALFDTWEDRYRYIIELGHKLQPLAEHERNAASKVPGCVSQAWLVNDGTPDCITFRGDSDAHIVRGLIAILLMLYSGKSAAQIKKVDARQIFDRLGLGEHLTPQRTNGFYSMVSRIRSIAEAL